MREPNLSLKLYLLNALIMCYRRLFRRKMRLLQIIFVVGIVLIVFKLQHMRQQLTRTASIKCLPTEGTEDVKQLQKDVDYLASTLRIHFIFLSETTAQLIFLCNGSRVIKTSGWAIYVSTALNLTYSTCFQDNAFAVEERLLSLSRVHGFLYKFEPGPGNCLFSPSESLKCNITMKKGFSLLTRFLVSPNWYIAGEGLVPRTISSTADQELSFISFPNMSRDSSITETTPDFGHAPLAVIPTPKTMVTGQTSNGKPGKVKVTSEWTVIAENRLQNERKFLSGKLGLEVSSSFNDKSKVILLSLLPMFDTEQSSSMAHESYELQVDNYKEIITITGESPAGVFYGVQTLLALVNDSGEVPQVSIKDSPRFSYRGLMIDVARHFQPKHEILKLLDVMAMYKMNKFHFHLSDSQGWRLQIPGLEELTTVGAKRCHDLQEKTCILSQLGSGPDTSTTGTGYYSTEDYREILRHANERHIQVIPEFDFPGHSHAAIKSMIARHDRKQGKENETRHVKKERKKQSFLLNDFEDKSLYVTVQRFVDDAINPCIPSTYDFIKYLLLTLVRIHHDIQPLTLFHFGGDEVPKGVWVDSPACQIFTRTFGRDALLIRQYLLESFVRMLSSITKMLSLDIGGWSDAFVSESADVLSRNTFNNSNVLAYFWGVEENYWQAINLAEEGYKVVLSPSHILYLDHSNEPSFEERGLNWATKYSDSRKIFQYSPPEHGHILGIEGAMWSELIHTADQMHGMLFPRLLAVAERAWHKGSWERLGASFERSQAIADDWSQFANTVAYRELDRLDKMGVAYHVPTPNARVICNDKCNKLHVTTELPGLIIEYSTDDGLTWNDVTPEMEVNGKIKLRTRSADQNRFSRVIEFNT